MFRRTFSLAALGLILAATVLGTTFATDAAVAQEAADSGKLRIVLVNGESVGDTLVSEGLARYYGNGRRPWC